MKELKYCKNFLYLERKKMETIIKEFYFFTIKHGVKTINCSLT